MRSSAVPNIESKHYVSATIAIVDHFGFECVTEVMAYHRKLVNIVQLVRSTIAEHGGDIIQSAGDAFVIMFDSSACASAIHAACDVDSRIKEVGAQVAVRIGIATGPLVITTIDSSHRSIVGTAFHLADRLLRNTRKVGCNIMVCAETAKRVPHLVQSPAIHLEGVAEERAMEAYPIVSTSHSAPAPR